VKPKDNVESSTDSNLKIRNFKDKTEATIQSLAQKDIEQARYSIHL
jgi:hypothetical protein